MPPSTQPDTFFVHEWTSAFRALTWLRHMESSEDVMRMAFGPNADTMNREYYAAKVKRWEETPLTFLLNLDAENRRRLMIAMAELYYPSKLNRTE